MIDLVSLGEMMLRLSPPKHERLRRAAALDVRACGAQFNLAANFAALGKHSLFLSHLPDNELGYLARSLGQSYGVDMSQVQLSDTPKMGLVFVEFSLAPRRQVHLYDRLGSAASRISSTDFAWSEILRGAHFAHTDGIFPALGVGPREAALAFLKAARECGCTASFDVNFRESLWSPDEALALYRRALPYVDILLTNRNVSEQVFGYKGDDEVLLQAYQQEFGCRIVCLTYKEMQGLRHGKWWSIARHQDQVIQGRAFEFDVIDPFGSGDAFLAGLLYGIADKGDLQYALDFGDALCALAHTIEGDQANVSPEEVANVLDEGYSLVTKR